MKNSKRNPGAFVGHGGREIGTKKLRVPEHLTGMEWEHLESLYTESQDNLNPFLIGSRILGLHSVTNGNKDYIFTDCKDYNLEWTRELRVWQGTNGMRGGTEKGI